MVSPVVGLLSLAFLLLLEVFILIVFAVLKRDKTAPKTVISEPKPDKYDWEKLIELKKPLVEQKTSSNKVAGIAVLVAVLVLLGVGTFFAVQPFISADNVTAAANVTIVTEPEPVADVSVDNVSPFSNLQLIPVVNKTAQTAFDFPDVSVQTLSIIGIIVGILIIAATAFFLFRFFRKQQRISPSLPKPVDEPITVKKAEAVFKETKKPVAANKVGIAPKPLISGFNWKKFRFPAVVVFLLLLIGVIVYFVRTKITGKLFPVFLSWFNSAKTFASDFKLFIVIDIVILIVLILILRWIPKNKKKILDFFTY